MFVFDCTCIQNTRSLHLYIKTPRNEWTTNVFDSKTIISFYDLLVLFIYANLIRKSYFFIAYTELRPNYLPYVKYMPDFFFLATFIALHTGTCPYFYKNIFFFLAIESFLNLFSLMMLDYMICLHKPLHTWP